MAHVRSVLLVDDDPALLRTYARLIRRGGHAVQVAGNGREALDRLRSGHFDLVLTDIDMPLLDGISLLREIRALNPSLPVVLITGNPSVRTAVEAVDHGAIRYLVKPVDWGELLQAIESGSQPRDDRPAVAAAFARAIDAVFMVYQPIVRWSSRAPYASEALLRSSDTTLSTPPALLDAAERLAQLTELGRKIRAHVASSAPADHLLFVNLHPNDLLDDQLFDPAAPLSALAKRVVLEITERASLHGVSNVRERVTALRRLGYRIAVDDLGAGYAGLASFAQLEPDVVKLDMSLVRDIDKEPTKKRLVRSMVILCHDLGLQIIGEGVETPSERDALIELGCDLMQGYLFARPSREPAVIRWAPDS
jgi:EAL domain-containing protein (putative c-di-GMP-specific phosphodiesterase class I)